LIEDELPLTEATYFILLSISFAPKHGYAIMKEVERLSEGRVRMSTGTLYGALKRLLDQGWIERVPEEEVEDDSDSDRPKKAYTLTMLGGKALQAEARRMQRLAEMARLYAPGADA
jgi:DNA-binding PadR family transcriptional regulator